MIVVSDASSLISMAAVGRLELLHTLYGTIVIPEGVYQEIAARGAGRPGANEVSTSPWVERRAVQNGPLVAALMARLGPGEAEAIALAVEAQANFLLMDERLGRAEAARIGLQVLGLLGVLKHAKSQGHLGAIKPVLDELVTKAGIRLSPSLYTRVLQDEGE
jgi:predicted nucleic acid-binding protein